MTAIGSTSGGALRYLKELVIDYPKNDIRITSHPAEMDVKRIDPNVDVDMQPVWDSIGLKNQMTNVMEAKQKNIYQSFEATGQLARDGDRVARIASKEKNPFGNIAVERFFRRNQVATNVGLMPEARPIIDVQVSPPEINVRVQSPEVEANVDRPRVRLVDTAASPATIDIRI